MSYRGHGNRDVKVLASVVLLVGEEVIPNLVKTQKNKQINKSKTDILKLCHLSR